MKLKTGDLLKPEKLMLKLNMLNVALLVISMTSAKRTVTVKAVELFAMIALSN